MSRLNVEFNFTESDWRLIIDALLMETENRRRMTEHLYKVKEDQAAFALSRFLGTYRRIQQKLQIFTACKLSVKT